MKKNEVNQTDATAEESALRELFIDELKDIYWAEKHLVKSLPKMAKAATSEELRKAFDEHLEQTKGHVERVEEVFELIDEKASAKKCEAMEGLIQEATDLIDETEDDTMTRDAALISGAQKVEHYEIASYGTLRTLAKVLGYDEVAEKLSETLEEEKEADSILTSVAEGQVNQAARAEHK